MGNNRLNKLILVHVHKNIMDNTNLADDANEFVDRKTAPNKQSDIFLKITHNICKIMSALRYFSYIYIYYQIYETWSCVTYYHSLNRFPKANDNCVSTY